MQDCWLIKNPVLRPFGKLMGSTGIREHHLGLPAISVSERFVEEAAGSMADHDSSKFLRNGRNAEQVSAFRQSINVLKPKSFL